MTQEEFDNHPAWKDANFEGAEANYVTKRNAHDTSGKTSLVGGGRNFFAAIPHQPASGYLRRPAAARKIKKTEKRNSETEKSSSFGITANCGKDCQ